MYTKEAEECFRCIAGVEAKSPCPEAVEANALAAFLRLEPSAEPALAPADNLLAAISELVRAPLPSGERRAAVYARRLVLARVDAVLREVRSLCAEGLGDLRDRALEARVDTAREEALAAAEAAAAGTAQRQSSFVQPSCAPTLSAVNVTPVMTEVVSRLTTPDTGTPRLASRPADLPFGDMRIVSQNDLPSPTEEEEDDDVMDDAGLSTARAESALISPRDMLSRHTSAPDDDVRQNSGVLAPRLDDVDVSGNEQETKPHDRRQVGVMWQLLLQKYSHVQQMEGQVARAKKQLHSLQLHSPAQAQPYQREARADRRSGEPISPKRGGRSHDSERAFLDTTENELAVLRSEIKSIESWLVQNGADLKPAKEEHKPLPAPALRPRPATNTSTHRPAEAKRVTKPAERKPSPRNRRSDVPARKKPERAFSPPSHATGSRRFPICSIGFTAAVAS
jgi:hypothetical protein